MKWRSLRLCFVTLVLSLWFADLASAQQQAREPESQGGRLEDTYRGGLVTPPLQKPRFTLTDTSGRAFNLWSETEGYVTLLFFGYAHCADVCPMHMRYLATALKKMPSGFADRFKVVFVTTDPTRDNPKALRAWLDHFDKRFIGLTGSEASIEAAQAAAKVPIAKKTHADAVDHVAFVLAYTKDNMAHVIYPSGVTQADWEHDLPQLLNGPWASR